jgi:integrase
LRALEGPFPGWIFPAPTKSGHIDHSSIKKQHANAIKNSKVQTFVIYSLRHICLTRWAEGGANPYELMRRAGYADLATTMRYIHMANPAPEKAKHDANEVQGTTKSPHRADFTVLDSGRRAARK